MPDRVSVTTSTAPIWPQAGTSSGATSRCRWPTACCRSRRRPATSTRRPTRPRTSCSGPRPAARSPIVFQDQPQGSPCSYQQGGIIVYGDDDNYVKLDRTATNASGATNTEFFEFIQEVAGTPRNATADHTANLAAGFLQDFYLRITYNGTTLVGAYSTDNQNSTASGQSSTALAGQPADRVSLRWNAATTDGDARRSTGSPSTARTCRRIRTACPVRARTPTRSSRPPRPTPFFSSPRCP